MNKDPQKTFRKEQRPKKLGLLSSRTSVSFASVAGLEVNPQNLPEEKVYTFEAVDVGNANVAAKAVIKQQIDKLKNANVKVPGLVENENGTLDVIVPSAFVDNNELTYLILARLIAQLDHVTLRKVENDSTHAPIDYQSQEGLFFIGLLLQADCAKEKQNLLGTNKISSIGLGRRAGFGLKVRGWFKKQNHRGFLKRNNLWFNNDPFVKANDKENGFVIRQICEGLSTETFNGLQLSKIYERLFEEISLKEFDEETLPSIIGANLIDFKTYSNKWKTKTEVQKGKGRGRRKVVVYRSPTIPRESPVLTKSENIIFSNIFSVVFPSLNTFNKGWTRMFITGEIDTLLPVLPEIFRVRNVLRQKYASMTTKRLQNLRMVDKEIKKKVDCNLKKLESYVSKVDSGYDKELISMIRSVFTRDQLRIWADTLDTSNSIEGLIKELDLKNNILQKQTDIQPLLSHEEEKGDGKNRVESTLFKWDLNYVQLMRTLTQVSKLKKSESYPKIGEKLDRHYKAMCSVVKATKNTSQNTWSAYMKHHSKTSGFPTDNGISNGRWTLSVHNTIEAFFDREDLETRSFKTITLWRIPVLRRELCKELIYKLS